MGFIPIFLTLSGAIILFFLTVKNTLQQKLNFHKEVIFKLKELYPALGLSVDPSENSEELLARIKAENLKKVMDPEALSLLKQLKINRHQYNQLISKAPYSWVARIFNFQPI